MKYVGLDWAYRTAQWCALDPGGEIAGEGRFAADRQLRATTAETPLRPRASTD